MQRRSYSPPPQRAASHHAAVPSSLRGRRTQNIATVVSGGHSALEQRCRYNALHDSSSRISRRDIVAGSTPSITSGNNISAPSHPGTSSHSIPVIVSQQQYVTTDVPTAALRGESNTVHLLTAFYLL